MGVRLSRWCTLHGLALNVANDLKQFAVIKPCGFPAEVMSSIAHEQPSATLTLPAVRECLIAHFCEVFGFHEVSQESRHT